MRHWILLLPGLFFVTFLPALAQDAPSAMVAIPGGGFFMGTTPEEIALAVDECLLRDGGACQPQSEDDSLPQAAIMVSPYQLEISEVTLAQYAAFLNRMGAGSHRSACNGQLCALTLDESDEALLLLRNGVYEIIEGEFNASAAMTHVSWYGAVAYCESIGRRLPSEAEWEFAARAGDTRIYPWGDTWDGSSFINQSQLHPYGLDAMAGSVAEWVIDWYARDTHSQRAAGQLGSEGPSAGLTKVVRGSWDPPLPFYFRTTQRKAHTPGGTAAWIGFRCAAGT